MKFTLDWLKEHLDTDADLRAVTDKLTAVGLELEEIEQSPLAPFVVAKVISAEQHPNADKLRVCKVDPGDGTVYNVVCGAPNARTGLVSVFAPVGTHIPGKDFTLELGSIRGERSEGMLCSEKELLISEDHDGIVELPEDAPIGMAYIDYRDINDPVIEINVTPNRADCLGVRGVARDLAAAKIGALKDNRPAYVGGQGASPVSVEIETDDCPIFTYRIVRNVKNGESPDWLKRKLEAIGQKPISALVDITNWMTLDQNRPMHVFDADKIAGGKLTGYRFVAREVVKQVASLMGFNYDPSAPNEVLPGGDFDGDLDELAASLVGQFPVEQAVARRLAPRPSRAPSATRRSSRTLRPGP